MTHDDEEDDVTRARRSFASSLHKRLEELGIDARNRVTYLQEKTGEKRWQTVQFWLNGDRFPRGHKVKRIAAALEMDPSALMAPMADTIDPPWPTWRTFLETKDGAAIDDEERWLLRLFQWPKPPAVEDYRGLLMVIRNNATRAA